LFQLAANGFHFGQFGHEIKLKFKNQKSKANFEI
jgi:hypothetical protein